MSNYADGHATGFDWSESFEKSIDLLYKCKAAFHHIQDSGMFWRDLVLSKDHVQCTGICSILTRRRLYPCQEFFYRSNLQ